MSLLSRLTFYSRPDSKNYWPLFVAGQKLGWLKPDFAQAMLEGENALLLRNKVLNFRASLADPSARSAAIAEMLERKKHLIPGWRNELYAVVANWGEAPAFLIERAAAPLFGVLAFAVNLVGYVKRGNEYYFWLGRRALTKHLAPGALDIMAGGGQPAGISIEDNLLKEAWEEAGVPRELSTQAQRTGHIAFAFETEIGLRREYQFTYALELPMDFKPKAIDGEVAEFLLLHQDEVLARLQGEEPFIIDTVFVLLDFFIRQGILLEKIPELPAVKSLLQQSADL